MQSEEDEPKYILKNFSAMIEPPSVSLSSLSIPSADDLPCIFDFKDKIQWLLSLDMIRRRANKHWQHFIQVFTSHHNIAYVQCLFWYLLIVRLPVIIHRGKSIQKHKADEIRERLHDKLSQQYVQLFLSIAPPKDKVASQIIFLDVFLICKVLNETFRQEEMELLVTQRFFMDCLHITIFQALGMEVCDRYVQLNLQQIFNNVFVDLPAEYQKKNQTKEAAIRKEKKMKEDKQTDFFEGKIAKPMPETQQQKEFLQELQENLQVEVKPENYKKRRAMSIGLSKFTQSKRSFSNTKSSFNDVREVEKSIWKKKVEEDQKKLKQQREQATFLRQMEKLQNSKSSQNFQPRSQNLRESLSVAKLGPCVSSFLNLRTNNIPGSKLKYISHPEEKVLTNDYLRRLLEEHRKEETAEAPEQATKYTVFDISKPMKGLSLLEISSYREITERQKIRQTLPQQMKPKTELLIPKPTEDVKLPKLQTKSTYARPQVVYDDDVESPTGNIFGRPDWVAPEEVPDDFQQKAYRNQGGRYRRQYG